MILLTKEVNTLLENNGLNELTISRNEDGFINLVGKDCHNTILTFTTMKVSSKLTKLEREILINDYILKVIVDNKPLLLKLIKTAQDTTSKDKLNKFIDEKKEENIIVNKGTNYIGLPNKAYETTVIAKKEFSTMSVLKIITNNTSSNQVTLIIDEKEEIQNNILLNIQEEIKNLQSIANEYKKIQKAFDIHLDNVREIKEELQQICKI